MPKYKIGITEAGDAGLDLSWEPKLSAVDGAILITKCISPSFYDAVLRNKDKVIVHATFTGYGGTVLEPCVPYPYDNYDALIHLIESGFPKEKVVIRVDPIIPTAKGIETAYNVFTSFIENGFNRFRVSIIDMYPHVRSRFVDAGLPLPYGENRFSPLPVQVEMVDELLACARLFWETNGHGCSLRLESCAEPGLTHALQCGCISAYDLQLLGLEPEDMSTGYQRRNCLCYAGKTELLSHKSRCGHRCLYCYWR